MKEEKSKLVSLVDKTFDEAKPLLENKNGKGLLVIGIDDTISDDMTALSGGIIGSKDRLVVGIAKMMDSSSEVREVLMDAVEFYKFKKSPIKNLMNTLKDLIGDIEEMKEASEKAEEEVPAEETNK